MAYQSTCNCEASRLSVATQLVQRYSSSSNSQLARVGSSQSQAARIDNALSHSHTITYGNGSMIISTARETILVLSDLVIILTANGAQQVYSRGSTGHGIYLNNCTLTINM